MGRRENCCEESRKNRNYCGALWNYPSILIASTDFVLEENRKEVYTIAFVTDGSADDRFQSLRKGMEKAAKKWNVDLVVDAPYLSGNAAEQEAAIEEAVEMARRR